MKKSFCVFFVAFTFFLISSGNIFAQGVSFTSPTPDDGATTTATSITTSATTTYSGQHYILNNFDNSLLGWWRAEDGANDESGNGNNGALNANATTTAGKFGQAFSFDGDGDYVSIDSGNEFNMATPNALTISTWVKSDSASVGNDCNIPTKRIIGYADISGAFDLDWDHCGLGGTSFSIYNGASYFAATTLLNASQWYHLVGVYNGTSVKLYVDGVLIDENATTGTINSASGFFTIGSDTAGTSNFSGLVDDTSLWNRALSAQEIRALYDASIANRYVNSDNSLKGWWAGDNTTDDEEELNNGTNNGATYSDGKFASAFSFDGSGQYVEIPNQSYFSADDGALSISFWAMVPEDAPSVSNDIAGDAGSYLITKTGENGYEWGIENDGNTQICFDYWNANNTYYCTNFTVNDGVYHHYLAMFDDVNGTFSFYIDGANKWDRSNTGGSNIANALNVPILIGSRMEKDSQHSFTGSIDDVMIFNKILSNNEIQELYNQSNNGYTNTFTSLALGDHTSQIFSADLTGSKDWSEERTFTIEAEPVAPPFANYGEEGIDGLSTSTAYTIATCEQLQNIATSSGIYLDKYFRLEPVGTSTIDCLETSGWNSYEGEGTQYYGFEPIGDSEVAFSGYFDGNNKIISNLYIDRYNTNYVGLFGYVEPGESEGTGRIENINLTNVNINGDYYVGALAGYLGGTTGNHGMIKNASSSGETEAYTLGAGGLIGLVGTYGDVEDSSSSSNVNSGYKAGGLAGVVQGSINNCSATGEINTDAYGAGGLVGYLKGGIVIESYATGDVNGGSSDSSLDQESSYAGGLVGLVNLGQIYRSYATGNVIGESIRVGGLVGGTNSIVENSYAWGNVEGADRVGGLVGGLTGEITNSYSIGTVTAGALVLNEGDEQTSYDGGGGGGGYFGGEGGQSDGIPGAGGSGYASSSVEDWILTTGNNGAGGERALPPNTTDENYVTGVGLGGIHNLNSGNGLVYLDYGSGDITFSYTGGSQTFTVPVGVTSISAKIWGAGGGGSSYSEEYQGGSGGYASGTILVTPLDTLVIIVGGGGGRAYANIIGGIGGYGGGGYGTRGDAAGGGGGGLSGIFTDENGTSFESLTQGDAVLIAGGGGGGTGYSGPGGAGGGEEGNNGGDDESCGGTQEAGGSCLENGSDGSALRGGNGDSTGIKGTAIPEYDYAGGLIGYSTGTTTNSYWDIESSEQENSPAGGTGTSTEVMKSQGTFSGWNFTDIWSIDNNYPLLRAFGSDGTNDNTPTVDVPVHRNTVIGSYVQTTRNPIVYSGVSGCEFVDTLINIGVISISESLSAKSLLGCDKILSTTTAYYFPRNLKLGMTGDDVKELQKFLNTHGFSLTKNGDGSAGFETTIFGSLTKNALIKFQEANFDDVLKPLNLTKGTGLFYDSTRTFVNKLLK